MTEEQEKLFARVVEAGFLPADGGGTPRYADRDYAKSEWVGDLTLELDIPGNPMRETFVLSLFVPRNVITRGDVPRFCFRSEEGSPTNWNICGAGYIAAQKAGDSLARTIGIYSEDGVREEFMSWSLMAMCLKVLKAALPESENKRRMFGLYSFPDLALLDHPKIAGIVDKLDLPAAREWWNRANLMEIR